MCPDPSRGLLLALGLILPLTSGAALAQAPGWVDPPAKSSPAVPAPAKPAPATPVEAPAAQAQESAGPATGEAAAQKPAVADAASKNETRMNETRMNETRMNETRMNETGMAGPSRRAERPRLRRRAARRLADTPAADALAIAPRIPPAAREASDPRFSDWAGRAQELAGDYLSAFSGTNDAMVAGAPRFYAERLRFHGRMTTLAALVAEKRRFARRWPERRYAPRSTRTACNAALQSCIVRTLVDFRARSPARGALSQGLAELVLEVSFSGGRPVIVSESSRVLRRGATVGALAGAGANG